MLREDRFIEKLIEIISDPSISDYKGRIFNILKDFKSDYLIQLAKQNGLKDRVNAQRFVFEAIEFINKKNIEQNLGGNPMRRVEYDKDIINLSESYETKSLIKKLESDNHSLMNELRKIKMKDNEEIENLKSTIISLQSTLNKETQKKVDANFSNYVKKATAILRAREKLLNNKSILWSKISAMALIFSAIVSAASLCWGYYEYSELEPSKITWLWATYGVMKGLLLIAMLYTLAIYAHSLSKAYTHESLKLGDRSHAIKLGEVFLQIYGSRIEPEEFKTIFENWNLNGSSAFYSKKEPSSDTNLDKDSIKKIIEELLPSQIIKNIDSIISTYRK